MPETDRIDPGGGFVRHQELLQELRLDIEAAYEALEKIGNLSTFEDV